MFSKFSEEAQKVLLNAKKEMSDLKHPYVGSEHLLLAILSNNNLEVTQRLNDLGLTYDSLKKEIIKVVGKGNISNDWFLYTPLLKRIIENATIDCRESKDKEVTVLHLFLSLLEEGDGVAIRILVGMNIDVDLLYDEFSNNFVVKKSKNKKGLMIEEFSVDLNKECLDGNIDPVIGRDNEINRVIEILSRRGKNNPLLIGDAGVGKTAIVEGLAERITLGLVPTNLLNKRILSVSMSSLIAGTKYRGEFEERVNKIVKEVEQNQDIIMFIDEIHTLVGAGGAEGAIDASNILKPALARGKLHLIGATTKEEYAKFLEKDKALDRRFQQIIIEEPDKNKTKDILLKLREIYESYHHTIISDEIVDFIVDSSDLYLKNRNFPDKAIDILDEVCAKTVLNKTKEEKKISHLNQKLNTILKLKKEEILKENFDKALELKQEQYDLETSINKLVVKNSKSIIPKEITKDMVIEVISEKANIPLSEFKISNKKVMTLEKKLNEVIKGQESAIKIICDYTKRKQLGFSDNKVHSFLLVGPTGVGKTLLVKEYAKEVYSRNHLIRLDMSEYKEPHSISKIIGAPPGYVGYDEENYLLEKIKNNPYSVLLLDEIEKASPSVIKLFLQVLDEGKMTDAKGREVYFNNVLIFMTSNLGTNKKALGFSNKNEDKMMKSLQDFFTIEFMNRIDDIVIFDNLSKEDIESIIKRKLKMLKDYYSKKDISLSFSKKLIEEISNETNYLEYGARKVDKIIDKKINNYIINKILLGDNKILVSDVA